MEYGQKTCRRHFCSGGWHGGMRNVWRLQSKKADGWRDKKKLSEKILKNLKRRKPQRERNSTHQEYDLVITQQAYEHNAISYLTHVMPKKEFEERFKK
ncbi:MAG: hypothetical protein LBJ88_00200 [Campylobacteraceae bacterium]|jgi:hypothetical protein|nr:hypothetical protein [Campylobacteraceae bacterium]